ncbi:MAG: site-specific DNA-methyltransferase [Candidatus Aenigmatarchaeota archaeon]
MGNKEEKFYNTLESIFVGAEVEGDSGYINLMKIKSKYYQNCIKPKLKNDIENALKQFPEFKEELFDKLYTFFSRYFSESGSIYFRFTPFHQNVYEKVYTDDKDVILSQKNHMLCYVKTDISFKSITVEIDGFKFFFDVSNLQHEKANEKREIIYEFKEIDNGVIVFNVSYKEENNKTNIEEILKAIKQNGINISKDTLERAFRIFEKQSEVNYFINNTLFSRYFSESGSIYFRFTPFHQDVYEKVYTDDKDVILFWKTHMLYYVKTDRLFKSMNVEIDGFKFFFDVSNLQHKKANEKREIIYEFKEKRDNGEIVFNVSYKEGNNKTNIEEILKAIKQNGINISEDTLERAFRIFEKQSEVDYFINKNAKEFLKEQFNLWMYQYVFSGESEWTEQRIKQLQVLKDIAFKIIDFISQFEDELVKIWNKPKFVLNSNYVITLDRIADKENGITLIEKILEHENIKAQIKEWKDLGIIEDDFDKSKVIENKLTGKQLNEKYKFLPIDTKYFKDLELEILGLFDDLDKSLDGWLIKSENYQALNTILPKFREKVQTIYIDPPYNTGSDEFLYEDKFKSSSWLTMMGNRLEVAKNFLRNDGNIFVSIDENQKNSLFFLMNEKFTYFKEVIWESGAPLRFKATTTVWPRIHETIFHFAKSNNNLYFPTYTLKKWKTGEPVLTGSIIKIDDHKIYSSDFAIGAKENTGFGTGQKPEKLIKLLFDASIDYHKGKQNIVMDFFLGSGTTIAVAQKLGIKWIGIELGTHFSEIFTKKVDRYGREIEKEIGCLGRMKIVLAGRGVKIEPTMLSKELNWQGGGFFKYYELEQYEDTLRKVKYEDSNCFNNSYEDLYNQYIFMKDKKMLEALEIDYENNKVNVDLSKLYKNIDIPETLSNLLGKWIKKITSDYVEFEDGERIDIKNLDYKLIKPLIWW